MRLERRQVVDLDERRRGGQFGWRCRQVEDLLRVRRAGTGVTVLVRADVVQRDFELQRRAG
ncbi:MAG: hypothetical protein ABJC51_05020, partial [Acidobacteriota bacterium]